MSDAKLRAAIQPYIEPTYRYVGLQPNPVGMTCDNAILFTGTYLALLKEPLKSELLDYARFLTQCAVPGQFGLYYRFPAYHDMNAHDDQTGIAAAAVYDEIGGHAREQHLHGVFNFWSWNTEVPGKWTLRSFFGRIPGHVATVKAAAGVGLNLIDILYAALGFYADTRVTDRNNTNGRCLMYLRQKVLRGQSKILDLVISYWRRKMKDMYPDGMREVYEIYFGPTHPFAIHGPENFE